MKETVNVSIASQAFTIDEDAWRLLDNYLNNIRSRIDAEDNETLADIEARIADIFREHLPSPMMVVSASLVRSVMEQIGSPDIFGAPREGGETSGNDAGYRRRSAGDDPWRKPLRRSATDRVLAGVCSGIANHFGSDPSVVRLVTLICIIFGGLSIWIYILLWIIIPSEPKN